MRECTQCKKPATSYLGWNIYLCDDCEDEFGRKIASPTPTIVVCVGFIVAFLMIIM